MKTIIKEINLFKFDELTEDQKLYAIEGNRDINIHFDWYEFLTYDFQEKNNNLFDIKQVYFSGFWSQGDGAMFEYNGINEDLKNESIENLNLPKWKKNILKKVCYISGNGKQSGHYYHENSCNHNIYVEDENNGYYDNISELIEMYADEIENYIIDTYKLLCRQLYRDLEKKYNYLVSDESITETLILNDYYFTEEGEIY